jgi:hypothetical protein
MPSPEMPGFAGFILVWRLSKMAPAPRKIDPTPFRKCQGSRPLFEFREGPAAQSCEGPDGSNVTGSRLLKMSRAPRPIFIQKGAPF